MGPPIGFPQGFYGKKRKKTSSTWKTKGRGSQKRERTKRKKIRAAWPCVTTTILPRDGNFHLVRT